MTLKELLRMFDTYTEIWINCLHVFENVQDIPEEWQSLQVEYIKPLGNDKVRIDLIKEV